NCIGHARTAVLNLHDVHGGVVPVPHGYHSEYGALAFAYGGLPLVRNRFLHRLDAVADKVLDDPEDIELVMTERRSIGLNLVNELNVVFASLGLKIGSG